MNSYADRFQVGVNGKAPPADGHVIRALTEYSNWLATGARKGGSVNDEDARHVAAFMNSHERLQDPRLVDGSVEKTRAKYHAGDGVNLYGKKVNGILLGQGIK